MRWKNSHDLQAYLKRRSERRAELGRGLENEVENLLQAMLDDGLIAEFRANAPNTKADQEGKDFTVTRLMDGARETRHFGVTISPRSWRTAKAVHNDVPQFCWPIGTNRDTMRRRILELFGA